ncbi:MAG: PEP-CTERM sorting domain-containing protein [Pirellulales bacterium]
MRNCLMCIATMVAVLFFAGVGQALAVPDYSFEVIAPSGANPPGPDGFFGLGATVAQEPVIGVTHLENSMRYTVGVGGFVGARTEIVPPTLNDPPGVKYVLFDLTLPAAYPDTFANMGVTIFGHDLNAGGGTSFGNQVQFADELLMAPLGAGTHLNQRIDLDFSLGPYVPSIGKSFNEIFGTCDDCLSVASAFQFYINKNVLTPIEVYIDNVRFVIPEPTTFGIMGMGAVVIGALRRRRSY